MNRLLSTAILVGFGAAWVDQRRGRRADVPGAIRADQTKPGVLYRMGAKDSFGVRYKRARIDPQVLRARIERKMTRLSLTGSERSRRDDFLRLDPKNTGEGFVLFERVDNKTGKPKRRPVFTDYALTRPDYALMFPAGVSTFKSAFDRPAPPPRQSLTLGAARK